MHPAPNFTAVRKAGVPYLILDRELVLDAQADNNLDDVWAKIAEATFTEGELGQLPSLHFVLTDEPAMTVNSMVKALNDVGEFTCNIRQTPRSFRTVHIVWGMSYYFGAAGSKARIDELNNPVELFKAV